MNELKKMQEDGAILKKQALLEQAPRIANNVIKSLRQKSGGMFDEAELMEEIFSQLRPISGNMITNEEVKIIKDAVTDQINLPILPPQDTPVRMQEGGPVATDVQQQFRTLDPTTRELYFGSGVPGTASYRPGFIQQAFRAAERTFYDEQGRPVVIPESVAGLSPEQLEAIRLSREAVGVQDPLLEEARRAYGSGLESLFGGLGESEQIMREYGRSRFDPSMTQRFYDPYQEQVIDQVRQDILEAGEQADIAQRARDVRAGESAFGSRARLGAEERAEALGRGLSETLGRLRSQGFQQAQQTALGEFGREQQRLANLASGIGSLAQTRQAGQVGFGQQLMGLGTQQQQAQQADIQRQLGLGQLTQAQQQRQLDAARANALMQQQAPLQQMQSLLPFVQSVPAGFSQIGTQFGVLPSPLQTGLGVGLSALGGLGSFFNPPQYRGYPTATATT